MPWSQCQAHEYENLIALCANCHRRADRGEIDRKALRIYKSNLRFTHDRFSQLEADILFELATVPEGHGVQWLPLMLPLVKRLLDARLLELHRPQGMIRSFGVDMTPVTLALTDAGRQYVADLGLHEL